MRQARRVREKNESGGVFMRFCLKGQTDRARHGMAEKEKGWRRLNDLMGKGTSEQSEGTEEANEMGAG